LNWLARVQWVHLTAIRIEGPGGKTSGPAGVAGQAELAIVAAALAFNGRPGLSESARERVAAIAKKA
jgi:hypothetical protein